MKRTLATLLALQTLVTPLLAQSSKPAAEEPLSKLAVSVDIRVINLDVVVNDKKGNPIRGLTANDFDVYENGVPQKITNFYEVQQQKPAATTASAAPSTAASAPAADDDAASRPQNLQRRIIFYIDNLSMAPFNRNRVFDAMKTFVREVMRPGDQAMIATWNRSMKIRVPFTSDQTQIIQNLDAISGESAFGLQNLSDRRNYESQIRDSRTYTDAIAAARQYSQSVEHDLRQSVSAINGLMATLAGVEGKKMLVLSSEGLPIQPGREMFYFIDDVKKERRDWTESGSSMLESMSYDATQLIRSIGNTANANGITLYTLHAGGLSAGAENSAENSKPTSYLVSNAALTNSTDSLLLLADMTGGRATIGTNNFKDAFAKIRTDAESYYSIGYRASTERVDRQRSVEVRAKNRAYVVRSRKSFVEKSVGTEMTDRIVANLFYPQKANDLKITVITGTPVQVERDRFKVPIEVHVPMESLAFLPQGEVNVGGFTVYLVVANSLGDMSDVQRLPQRLTLTKSELDGIGGKHFTYTAELLMEKGRNKISVGVVDDVSNMTGFDRRDILAADLR